MRKVSVHSLLTVPEGAPFDSCTLVINSIKTGFPNANIKFHINAFITPACEAQRVVRKIHDAGFSTGDWQWTRGMDGQQQAVHLGYWIKRIIEDHEKWDAPGPLVIVDGDTHFWKSCEDFTFSKLWAGYYVPYIWNDFAQCASFPRLHTSFLWFGDTVELLRKCAEFHPPSFGAHWDYCPIEYIMTGIRPIGGMPFYWDCMSGLYNAIPGESFQQNHLDCFEHLNSASFFKIMHERLEAKDGFKFLHTYAPTHMDQVRGQLWPIVNDYYQRKHVEAKRRVPIDWFNLWRA